jgi:hypothetical protein
MIGAFFLCFLIYFSFPTLSWVLAGWRENVFDTLRVVSLGARSDCNNKVMLCLDGLGFFILLPGEL